MSDAGFILGGLLAGAGQGMAQDIQDRRAMALQQLRGQQQADSDKRQAQAQADQDERKFVYGKGLIATQGAVDIAKDNASSGNKIKQITVEGGIQLKKESMRIQGEQNLAKLNGQIGLQLQGAKSADAEKLARVQGEIDSGRVASMQQTADGGWFIIRKDGSTMSTGMIGAAPGKKVEDDVISSRANRGATPAPTPATTAAPSPPAAAPARPNAPAAKTGARGLPILSPRDANKAWGDAQRKRASGKDGWAGLNDDQLREKLADIYAANGYDLPT